MSNSPPESTFDLAMRMLAAGLSVLPIRLHAKKAPALPEGDAILLGQQRATERDLRDWYKFHNYGVAAKCGPISGGLECLDFDEAGLFELWLVDVEKVAPGLVGRLTLVTTPSGGAHAWFRSADCGRNQVLAKRPSTEDELAEKPKVLWQKRIETRGTGGYALLPGGPVEVHDSGRPYTYSALGVGDITNVPTITTDERQTLIDCCRAYSTYAEEPRGQPAPPPPPRSGGGKRPGDDYEERGSWPELLEPLGWKLDSGTWDKGRLTRPGKDHGCSATIGVCRGKANEPLLNVFSTSAGVEPGCYGLWRAFTYLLHGGDYSAAAKALAAKGYGEQRAATVANHSNDRTTLLTPTVSNAYGDVGDNELVLRSLKGRKAKPVRFLVEGRIPLGKMTMFAGEGGMGKSTLIRHLVACLTTGRAAFGLDYTPPPPCDVLLASVEDDPEDTILPHLLAEGADLDRVIMIEGIRRTDGDGKRYVSEFDLRDTDLVLKYCRNNPQARMLIIDPILSFVGRAGAKENSSSEVRVLLDPLATLASQTNMATLLIAHLNKATNAAATNRILGATAFRDACRTVWSVGKDPDDPKRRIMSHIKSNVPGLDVTSLLFRREQLPQSRLAEVLASEEFSELTPDDLTRIEKQLAYIQPLGVSERSADEVLSAGQPAREGNTHSDSKQAACAEWIKERVGAEYSWLDEEIEKEAVAAGFSIWQYRRAKGFVPGLSVKRIGFGKNSKFRIGMGNISEMPFGEHEGPTDEHQEQDDGPDMWPA